MEGKIPPDSYYLTEYLGNGIVQVGTPVFAK